MSFVPSATAMAALHRRRDPSRAPEPVAILATQRSDMGPIGDPRVRTGWVDVALLLTAGLLWFGPLELVALGLLPPALVAWRHRRGWGDWPLLWPLLALPGLGVAAVGASQELGLSLPRLLGLWLGAALCLAIADVLDSEKRLWVVVSGLAGLGMGVALAGLLVTDWGQAAGLGSALAGLWGTPWRWPPGGGEDAVSLHPNKLAAALAMLLPLPVAVLVFTPGRLLRLGWGLGAGVIGLVLLLTGSRSGLLAAGVALLALGAVRSRRCRLVLPAVAAAAVGLVWWAGPDEVAMSLLELAPRPDEPPTLAARWELWGLALRLIGEHPLLGIGLGAFPLEVERLGPTRWAAAGVAVPHAHNLYLQFALDLGLPGLAAFLALLVGACILTRRAVRRGRTARARGLVAGVTCGLLAYLVYGLTDAIGPGEKPGLFFWLLVGIIAAGARLPLREACGRAARVSGGHDARSGAARPFGSVIYVSSFEWSYHTARPQQLARALAESRPVLYVETTGLRGVGVRDIPRLIRRLRRGLGGRQQVLPNVWVFSPIVLPFRGPPVARTINRLLLRDAIRGQARDIGLRDPLLLISNPTAASVDLVGQLGEVASVYDCMDDLTTIPQVDRSVVQTEAELSWRVDVMVAASAELRRLKEHLRPDIAVVGQGVDLEHFGRGTVPPRELLDLPRPLLLSVGGIDERLDFELLNEVARRRPEWSIVLVGPELYLRARELVDRPNIHLLGQRRFEVLPAYLQAADVCLIPYRDSAWARACNPVKTLEYLAAGRPVVSTALPAVREYQPWVRIARNPDELVAAVEAALAEDGPAGREARRALAVGVSWRDRAAAIWELAAATSGRGTRELVRQ